MFNRKKLAVPSVLLAAFVFCSSAGVPAYAGDVSGSEAVSVETTKEAPAEAPVEETKKAEEPPAPVKEAPAASVVVAPAAPPVEQPAPAPVIPEPVVAPAPAVPAPPVAPQVATPAAPELPAAPVKDVVIDDPAPVVVAPVETPPACEPSWNVSVDTFFDTQRLPGWGTFLPGGTVTCGVAGASYGDYSLLLTNAIFYPTGGTVGNIGALKTSNGVSFDGVNLFWSCAREGASYSLVDNTTGLSVTGVVPLPGGVDAGDSRCGTTTPVQAVVEVNPSKPTIVLAGPDQKGSVSVPEIRINDCATFVATPAGAYQGDVAWEWKLDAETPTKKCVFAAGVTPDQISDTAHLGVYEQGTVEPNPGVNPEFVGGGVANGGKTSPATLIPVEGPFNQPVLVFPVVTGNTSDGSPVTITLPQGTDPIKTLGGNPITVDLDLTGLCGTAHWTWYAKADAEQDSSKWIVASGIVTGMPACDPQGGDDGGDNENPNPNPDPSHPGHGHDHDGDHDHDCDWWNGGNCNGHAGGPGFNGPTTTPGDLASNDVTDTSVSSFVVQSSVGEAFGLGNASPDVSEWPSGNSSDQELAATGAKIDPAVAAGTILGLIVLGVFLFVVGRRPKRRMV